MVSIIVDLLSSFPKTSIQEKGTEYRQGEEWKGRHVLGHSILQVNSGGKGMPSQKQVDLDCNINSTNGKYYFFPDRKTEIKNSVTCPCLWLFPLYNTVAL